MNTKDQLKLGNINSWGDKYGKCPVCGTKQWFYPYQTYATCHPYSNQKRWKHAKDNNQIFVADIIWVEDCLKSKELL